MDTALISLIMDALLLLALAGTMFFVFKLTKSLNNFKAQRDQMRVMITELSSNVDMAQEAITALKSSTNNAANELDDLLHESRRMAEELKLINDSGNSLANRLEGLASSARTNPAPNNPAPNNVAMPSFGANGGQKTQAEPEDLGFDDDLSAFDKGDEGLPSFFIKDADFENAPAEEEAGPSQFSSKAERELYEALQKNKTRQG